MPVGACSRCRRLFVIEDERSFQRTCPLCLKPMRLTTEAAAASLLRQSEPGAASEPEDEERLWLDGAPLGVNERGRRMLTATAEAAFQRSRSQYLRLQARMLRCAEALPPLETAGTGTLNTFLQSAPGRADRTARGVADWSSDSLREELVRALRLLQETRSLVEQAQSACLNARVIRGIARVLREDLRGHVPLSPDLPPLDYVFLPPGAPLPPLVEEDEPEIDPFDEIAPAPHSTPHRGALVTLFVWGYEPPRSLFCREQCEESAAAALFAAAAGWDGTQSGAWAREITLPCGLAEALRGLKQVLQQDPAVAGWGVRHRRTG